MIEDDARRQDDFLAMIERLPADVRGPMIAMLLVEISSVVDHADALFSQSQVLAILCGKTVPAESIAAWKRGVAATRAFVPQAMGDQRLALASEAQRRPVLVALWQALSNAHRSRDQYQQTLDVLRSAIATAKPVEPPSNVVALR